MALSQVNWITPMTYHHSRFILQIKYKLHGQSMLMLNRK